MDTQKKKEELEEEFDKVVDKIKGLQSYAERLKGRYELLTEMEEEDGDVDGKE